MVREACFGLTVSGAPMHTLVNTLAHHLPQHTPVLGRWSDFCFKKKAGLGTTGAWRNWWPGLGWPTGRLGCALLAKLCAATGPPAEIAQIQPCQKTHSVGSACQFGMPSSASPVCCSPGGYAIDTQNYHQEHKEPCGQFFARRKSNVMAQNCRAVKTVQYRMGRAPKAGQRQGNEAARSSTERKHRMPSMQVQKSDVDE